MLLDIAKTVTLHTPAAAVWSLLQQPVAVAGCLPDIRDFRAAGQPDRYTTLMVERLGPFQVQMGLTIDVAVDAGAQQVVARVAGEDRTGQARVRGEVTAAVRPAGEDAILEVVSHVEVLGRMATLGAVPMRRRGDQIFEQFIANIGALLGEQHG